MPLFFFHLRTGAHLDEDALGVDLPDIGAARREALRAVADMTRDAALTDTTLKGEAFEIADRDGRLALTVPFDALLDRTLPARGRAGQGDHLSEGPMPRYHFNIRRKGVLIEDPDGEEAADLEAIRRVAEDTIEDILRRPETYGQNQNWDRCAFEITDERGATVMKVPFSEFNSPD